jgi:glyoxylase-like metal-dependent hydrolase (beta-lactamase superfamily II)
MNVAVLEVGPFLSNCFVVSCEETNEAIIVDAGDDASNILAYVEDKGLEVQMVVCTHAHIDHVSALAHVTLALSVPALLHRNELPIYEHLPEAARMFGLPIPETTKIERFVAGGDEIKFGKVTGRVVETPGHSPGGITLVFEDATPPTAFVGDVLFQGSIGRTDLPGSNHAVMMSTLKDTIMTMPDDMVVYSGHGPATTIGTEKKTNPFLQALAD